jgi:hypothetical protein
MRMTTSRARRIEVPVAVRSGLVGGRFAEADFSWACEYPAKSADSGTPERWARGVFEDAPVWLRWILIFGWKIGLGLKMGPSSSPRHVLGWHIRQSDAQAVTLEAGSAMMDTQNVVLVNDSGVTWVTFVRFNNRLGRVLWLLAAPIHQWLIPRSLNRANRSRFDAGSA